MKLSLIVGLVLIIHSATLATVHIITCQNSPSHFYPSKSMQGWVIRSDGYGLMVAILWARLNQLDIPKGAPHLTHPIDAGHTSFEYVVSIAGNYM